MSYREENVTGESDDTRQAAEQWLAAEMQCYVERGEVEVVEVNQNGLIVYQFTGKTGAP